MVSLMNVRLCTGALAALAFLSPLNLRAEDGVTDTSVVVGMPAAFDGPSAGLGVEMWRGVGTAFAEANEAGGINGRKVELKLASDGYDAERAAPAVATLLGQKVFCVGFGVGTPTIVKSLPLILKKYGENGLFYFANFTGAQPQREPPYDKIVFNVRASYREETRAMVDAFAAAGKKKIGIFVQDDAYGASGRDGVSRALASHGLALAADTTYPRGQLFEASTADQIKILKDAGVDAIVSVGSYQACAAFIRDARESGWNVPIHNVSFVGADQMLGLLSKEEKASGKKLITNLIVTQVTPSYLDTSIKLVKEYREAITRQKLTTPPAKSAGGVFDGSYVPANTYSFGSLEGYLSGRAFLAILQKAGKSLTRKAFYDAAEGMGKLDLGLGVPLEFSPSRHQALQQIWFTCGTEQGWKSTQNPASCSSGS